MFRLVLALSMCTLLAIPAMARDGSKTATDQHESHGARDKGTFHDLKEELKHLNDPIDGVPGGPTYGDQFLGDIANALDPDYSGTGKAGINAGQAKSLEKAYDRATSNGTFSGHSGALGSQDIGGIP